MTDALEYAKTLIRNHGWVEASRIAEAEAAPHSPSGNRDGFWTAVLEEINSFGR